MSETLREGVERTLQVHASHLGWVPPSGVWNAGCLGCDWRDNGEMGGGPAAVAAHRSHLTDALLAATGPTPDEVGLVDLLAGVVWAHTGETCHDLNCGEGFGYHDVETTAERRRGCDHLAVRLARAAQGYVVRTGKPIATPEAVSDPVARVSGGKEGMA